MNLTRIKFAWARGARIERFWREGPRWIQYENIDDIFGDPDATLRIHPADKHLEYGPLSSALLADLMTTTGVADPDGYADTGWELFHIERRKHNITRIDDMDALLFCEYLADMGL